MIHRSLSVLAANVRAEIAAGNDALRQQALLLGTPLKPAPPHPGTPSGTRPSQPAVRTRPHGMLLIVGLVVGLGSALALVLQPGSVIRQHPVVAWASVALVGIFVVVSSISWIRGRQDHPTGH
jgi:hypothetical protein